MKFLAQLRLLVTTLWAGSLWTVGYLVAPTAFMQLPDRAMAGAVAGLMFSSEAMLSVVCGGLLLLCERLQPTPQRKVVVALSALIVLLTVAIHWGLQPMMAAARGTPQFGMLHGISSALYLVQSLLAVALVLKSSRA